MGTKTLIKSIKSGFTKQEDESDKNVGKGPVDKGFQLTEENQKYSKEFVTKLLALRDSYGKLAEKKKTAIEKLIVLEERLSSLNGDHLLIELDEEKLEKLREEKRDIQFQLDELKVIAGTNIKLILKERYKELIHLPLRGQASSESLSYAEMLNAEIKAVQEEANAKIRELERLKDGHIYNRVDVLRAGITEDIHKPFD